MIERIVRLVQLDWSVFKEIEPDASATAEAAIIVAVTSLLSALGSAIGSHSAGASFVSGLVSGLVGWVVWAVVAYLVGKALFKGRGTLDGMLRVLGYASAPNILGFFGFVPCIGWLAGLAGWLISLIAGLMAIKEGLDLDLASAVGVAIVGWIAMAIVSLIISVIFGGAIAAALGIVSLLGRAIPSR